MLAFAEAHVLAQSPLGWIPAFNDTPVAVSGETLGPGDDLRAEFGGGLLPFEAQAKHGLNAAGDLDEVIARVRSSFVLAGGVAAPDDAATSSSTPSTWSAPSATHVATPAGGVDRVVLVVNRASTRALYTEFAEDLIRLRAGRSDGARPTLQRLLDADASATSVLTRLFVVAVDIDRADQPEAKHAIELLQRALEDATQVVAAWDVLVADANDVCAQRLRRDRPALVQLLESRGIRVKPPAPDEPWMRQLDFTRELLHRHHAAASLSWLRQLEADVRAAQRSRGTPASAQVRYRLAQQQGAAYRTLGRPQEARDASERALDVESEGVHALVIAAAASADMGDLPAASAYARRAVHTHPADANAWACLVQIARVTGEAIPVTPAEVEASSTFRTALAHVAMAAGDWASALRLTAELLAAGERSNDVLFVRTAALVNAQATAAREPDAAALQDYREAARLATEAIEQIADSAHPFTAQLYVARAWARRLLDDVASADADLAEARRIDREDPNALRHTAVALLESGREREALAVLRDPLVDVDARLLTMRAWLLARLKLGDEARDALAQLESLIAVAGVAADVHAQIAETALLLDDASRARAALERVTADAQHLPPVLLARARLAVVDGQTDVGVALYRAVALAVPSDRQLVLAEAADALRHARRPGDAVALYEETLAGGDPAHLPQDIARGYAVALMQAHRLVPAQSLVDAILSRDVTDAPTPTWVLGLATEIAFARDDLESAIRHLEALAARERSDPWIRIQLAQWMLEVGRTEDANTHIAWLLTNLPGSPDGCMAVAQLLIATDRVEEGLGVAFRAFRAGGDRPALHRTFAALVLTSRSAPPNRRVVEADTHVRLRRNTGEVRRVTVFAAPPIDPRRDEMSVEDAEAAGILGKTVGDLVVRDFGTWRHEQWTIEALMPAIQFAALDAAEHFAERFPGEPFFVAGLPGLEKGTGAVDALVAAMRASLLERRAHVRHVFEVYRTATLPLGFVAHATGATVVGAMRFLSDELRLGAEPWEATAVEPRNEEADADGPDATLGALDATATDEATAQTDANAGSDTVTDAPSAAAEPQMPSTSAPAPAGPPGTRHRHLPHREVARSRPLIQRIPPLLMVEWTDRSGQAESRAAARDATELILTRSAIETLERLELLRTLPPLFTLAAPRALREVLLRELREAERHLHDGYRNVASASQGLSLVDHEAGSPVLQRLRDRASARLNWFHESVRVHPRPLEMIPPAGSPEAEARTLIGSDSLDAVHLAQHRRSTMYADDLGLRRFIRPGEPGRSSSTVGILRALVDREVLSPVEADRHLLRLVEWRYAAIPLSDSLLSLAVATAASLPTDTLRNAFGLLAAGEVQLDESVRVAARVVYRLAVSAVRVMSIAGAVDMALAAIGTRWGARAAAFGLRREARLVLRLLPIELVVVEERCTRFARDGTMAALTFSSYDPT
ncbi:MAG TPA: hypothetical protein VE869_15680 [Gemmatimonas sp.]|nr:hypothetical protein [Gemmatimonas sp.]